MARRVTKKPSRMDLRREVEAAEQREEDDDEPVGTDEPSKVVEKGDDEEGKKPAKKKVARKKAVRRKSSKKSGVPQRLRLVWGVFDNSNQQVSTFPYLQRGDADKRAAELTEKGRGTYFVQPVKEAIPEEPKPAE
jgi:hypothetical protein